MKTTRRKKKAPLPKGRVCAPRTELEPVCERFSKLLVRLRKWKRWSLEDVARITHLTRQYLSDLENKMCNPTLDVMARIGHAFHISLKRMMEMSARLILLGAMFVPEGCPI